MISNDVENKSQDMEENLLNQIIRLASQTNGGQHIITKRHPKDIMIPQSSNVQELSTGASTKSSGDFKSRQQDYSKRKEFEQDLDNGDKADFLRLPY